MSEDYILKVEHVRKTFGGIVALDDVVMGVRRGTMTALIGPNGSGKTTLFNVIAGVYKPDRGKVYFDGHDITGMPPEKIYHLGLVRTFQIPRMFKGMTVYENVLTAARNNPGESYAKSLIRSIWKRAELGIANKAVDTMKLLKILHIAKNLSSAISGGQMKLVELARGLMSDPKMLLLDEPAAGVNPTLAHEIFKFLRHLRDERGMSMLIIEHRLDILFDYVDYVYVMHRGRIVAEGTPEEVSENPVVVEIYLGEA
ncbi:branched-chain amino acid ABC transporter substrate-binding protein [Ignicoccus pacificus DSM 13166]|uniref:Probable branched-chain amino acid transport ATP-binding protein LivG n=1 Tax=Ignicoccus pacificus DSM 13166 TaxID=940294 RepID=A0A977PL42_9CREN|nr:branched-chain amino acid ABC transporter substrate-binding protein [Ignicoccus pacificus DSM 13166]